jgi:hypothetical protein
MHVIIFLHKRLCFYIHSGPASARNLELGWSRGASEGGEIAWSFMNFG